MEDKYKYSRSLKTKKAAMAFVRAYMLTDYEIKNTSFKREYQGRIANSSEYTVYYNPPLPVKAIN
jgi:hypothetical protein